MKKRGVKFFHLSEQSLGPAFLMSVLIGLANVLFRYPINTYLTWGTPIIALTFGVNELVHLKFGTQTTVRTVSLGIFGGLLLTLWAAPGQIALASATAFLCAHISDVLLFRRLRNQTWWMAPLFASAAATLLDTTLFFTIAFWRDWSLTGPLVVGDFLAKLTVDLLLLVPFRMAFRARSKLCLTGSLGVANGPSL